MKRKKSVGRRVNSVAVNRMPLWLTRGVESATNQASFDSVETTARACLLALKMGAAEQVNVNTIGKFIALVRLVCIMDEPLKKKNGFDAMWALAVQCAEIFRDADRDVKQNGKAKLDDDDVTMLDTFIGAASDFLIRHSPQEVGNAWKLLDTPGTLSLLLGIDPETGENSDIGKLDRWIDERGKAAA